MQRSAVHEKLVSRAKSGPGRRERFVCVGHCRCGERHRTENSETESETAEGGRKRACAFLTRVPISGDGTCAVLLVVVPVDANNILVLCNLKRSRLLAKESGTYR